MPLTEGDGLWESFDALLEHANEAQLNQMIGRIRNHARRLVEAHDDEGKRIETLRRLIGDSPLKEEPKQRTRVKRSDAGRPRAIKPLLKPLPRDVDGDPIRRDPFARAADAGKPRSTKPVAVASDPVDTPDPFEPILVGYEGDA
jgi:hypothetical protein